MHHTFNPWWGCTRVSPGCDHCYAEGIDARAGGGHWGKGAPRRTFGEKYWAGPLAWEREAVRRGERQRVLCASMADVFDAEAPEGELPKLWALIQRTPHLDWLLLTKRPARIARSLPSDWGEGYPNAWLGVSVEDADTAAQRLPVLLSVPARLRFACCEPILGPLPLRPWLSGLDWVIAGGESGPHARPLHPDWVRDLRVQCVEADCPFFFKQWGEYLPGDPRSAAPGRRTGLSARHPGFYRVGKVRAGSVLDSVTWEQLPRAAQASAAAEAHA
ncbi:phage Gp37/Gp68 family protein [Aggregicoccus sp. 17bor-14]|uniref:phage Gp37/Gp68 family protein n=1 Tax=Myxococcaceae TaxID=31 RepID=UPI00351A31A6